MSKLLITGSHGYVGSRLVPALLDLGHEVVGYDLMLFGDHIGPRSRLQTIKADIRDIDAFRSAVQGCDAVLALACISNDPSFELDEELSRTINYECFEPLVVEAKRAGVRRFIYASTSSVYGISESPDVTEDHPFVPITLYNRYKGMCEPLLLKHQSDDFTTTIIRPATVCGYSPRMRLDLSVNILTNLAVNRGEITVFGGAQKRPNIHIEDLCRAYLMLLDAPKEKIAGEAFNCSMQNRSIMDLAEEVQRVVGNRYSRLIQIKVEPVVDQRSYQLNSEKIKRVLGFRPRKTVADAITELCDAFDRNLMPDPLTNPIFFNVKSLIAERNNGVLSDIDALRIKGAA